MDLVFRVGDTNERNRSLWDDVLVYEPYYDDGIIAIDGCTVSSGIVNCIVIED